MNSPREELIRFGVAVPAPLLESFDQRIAKSGLPNRSEALRQLIREYVARDTWQTRRGVVCGTITMTYNHHCNDLTGRLTELQHDFGEVIVCTTHVHADHDHCLEVLVIKGAVPQVHHFIAELRSLKGISSIEPVITVLAQA